MDVSKYADDAVWASVRFPQFLVYLQFKLHPFILVFFAKAVAVLKELHYFRNIPREDSFIIIDYLSLLQALSSLAVAVCNKTANIITQIDLTINKSYARDQP